MEKLHICRLCFANDVPLHIVYNRDLQKLFEKLTDIPFVTADRRSIQACVSCCNKIKLCLQFQIRCLEVDKLFALKISEDCEPYSLVNPHNLNVCVSEPRESFHIESITIEPEIQAVCEKPNEVIDLCDDEPVTGETQLQETITEEHKKYEQSKLKDTQTTQTRTPKTYKCDECHYYCYLKNDLIKHSLIHKCEKPYKCDLCQIIFFAKTSLIRHTRLHTGERPNKCDECQGSFIDKGSLKKHIIRLHTR